MTISHSEQLASYKVNVPLQVKTAVDIEVLLPYMDSYIVNEYADGSFECELVPLPISGLPFEEMLITFRSDYSLERQEMLSYKKRRVKDSLGVRQVVDKTNMVLCFSELQAISSTDKLPKLSSYIKNITTTPTLINTIRHYQLID